MLNRIRSIMMVALAAGLMWGCGGDRGMESFEAEEQIGRPLSKIAVADDMSQATVVATVSQDDAPVSGVMVEFARSIAGQAPDYHWSGMTDDMGRVTVEMSGQASGYYQARASWDGSVMGRWSSIPINGGYRTMVALPIGGRAQVTGTSERVTIGIVLPVTGSLHDSFGIPIQQGLDLARQGIGNVELKFVIEDDQSTVEGAVAAYNKLIQAGVPVIIGPPTSSQTRMVFPIAQENQVVAISPTSAATGLSALGDFVFRVALTTDVLIPSGIEATHEKLGYQTAATLYDELDFFSIDSDKVIREVLAAKGVEVLSTETFQSNDTDFSEQLTRIQALNPDVIFVSSLSPEKSEILKQGHQLGISATFIVRTLTVENVQKAGAAAEGAITFIGWGAAFDTPGNHAFVQNYRAEYGGEPNNYVARAYTTLRILAEAIANAQSTEPTAIRDALANIRDFDTVFGKFSYDANGDAVYDAKVLIVKDGNLEIFDAQPVSQATAIINETNESGLTGKAVFTQDGDNIKFVISLANASPGEHAVHIHETGDCSAPDGKSAGGHWNPTGVAHGKWGEGEFHLGDIGNLTANAQGMGKLELTTNLWEMNTGSDIDFVGKAIIVHADADDFVSQPSGNAGPRIGCGVIEFGQ